jgi:hypothetical protein
MVEGRWSPDGRRVAWTTVMTEIASNMVGICRLRKLHLMTLIAIVEHKSIVAIHVARLTLARDVRTGQGKVRGVMVKRCRTPATCCVALRTVM